MGFTQNQDLAIKSTDKNITVAASAGSGKTTVLVARIMKRVMEDRVPLDRFLAMTFTEAAANEMKSRLFGRLTEYMTKHPEEKEYCNEQLVLLSKAQISTIHSFCLNVIQENYAYIGFDLQRANTIISEEEEEAYFRKAFDATVKKFETLPQYSELKQNFSSKVYDSTKFYKELRSLAKLLKGTDFNQFYALNQAVYTAKSIQSFPQSAKDSLFSFLNDYVDYLGNVTSKLYSIPDIQSFIKIRKDYLDEMRKACYSQDYALFLLQFYGFTKIAFPTVKDDVLYETCKDELRAIEEYLLESLFDESTIIKDLNSQWPLIDVFLQMANYYNELVDSYKEEYCFMDFDDMELYALQILSQFPEVADIYKHRFIDILVDEYQDSSTHQDEILSHITRGDNIFRVGDVKQSIYRFRNATPDLFKGYIEHPTNKDQVIFLQENFRSNSQIIEYVNKTFENFMNLPTFQSNFANDDIAYIGTDEQKTNKTCVEYHVLKNDQFDDEDFEGSSANQLRAEYIASQIIEIHDKEQCKWKNFVVLVRSNERKIDLKRAFTKFGIPNFIDSKEGFYKSSAVTYITNFMQCILSPHVDNYFVALAMSPFYGLNDNRLAEITLDKKAKQCYSYYDYAQKYGDTVLSAMVEDIKSLRYLNSLRDKLIKIYTINHFYDTYTTHTDRTNLDSLLEKASTYEDNHSDGLEGFCSFISSLKEFKSSEALSVNSKEDVVRVMTVHQSKGLQFPYVFYWGKERSNTQLEDNLLKHTNLGIYLDYSVLDKHIKRTSIMREVVSHICGKADLEEEIRVIYVALTRPSQKLILTTLLNSNQFDAIRNQNISAYSLYRKEAFAKWLLGDAFRLSNLVQVKEVTSFDTTKNQVLLNPNTFKLQPLNDYEHNSLKQKPSNHGAKLFDLTENVAMEIGSLTHKLLENIDFTKEYTIEELTEMANQYFDSKYISHISYRNIQNFLCHPMTKEFISKTMYREIDILDTENNQITSGVIDLLVEDDSTVYIVDYKTDNLTSDELISRYTNQLNTYQAILKKKYPTKEIKKYIYSLHLNEYILIK